MSQLGSSRSSDYRKYAVIGGGLLGAVLAVGALYVFAGALLTIGALVLVALAGGAVIGMRPDLVGQGSRGSSLGGSRSRRRSPTRSKSRGKSKSKNKSKGRSKSPSAQKPPAQEQNVDDLLDDLDEYDDIDNIDPAMIEDVDLGDADFGDAQAGVFSDGGSDDNRLEEL